MAKEDIGIVVERKSALATVTIERPDRLNAFNQAMFEALGDAARALSKETLPRAVIITGAGSDAFSAGFDVNPDNPMVAEMARALDRGEKNPITRSIAALRAAVDRFVAQRLRASAGSRSVTSQRELQAALQVLEPGPGGPLPPAG